MWYLIQFLIKTFHIGYASSTILGNCAQERNLTLTDFKVIKIDLKWRKTSKNRHRLSCKLYYSFKSGLVVTLKGLNYNLDAWLDAQNVKSSSVTFNLLYGYICANESTYPKTSKNGVLTFMAQIFHQLSLNLLVDEGILWGLVEIHHVSPTKVKVITISGSWCRYPLLVIVSKYDSNLS